MTNKKHFWNWAGNPDSRELFLCGTIAEESWLDDDITPELFKSELMEGSGPITVWLNSYGGDVIAASRIFTMLIDYPDEVTVKIDGIAASAASVVAMAGTKVLMAPTACMMIHDPMTIAVGNTGEMEKAISMLDTVKESIIDAYEMKTGIDRKAIAKLMSEETWMDSKKAIELGFADGVLEKETMPVNDAADPVLFSQKAVDRAFAMKLRPDPKSDPPETADQSKTVVPPETMVPPEPMIPAKPLYDRLEKLKSSVR